MSEQRQEDAVDRILAQWHQERPDLDVGPMAIIGRLSRSAALMSRQLELAFSQFGMTAWEFDVLATLRRSGAPYCLAPTALFSTLMITSGTMTHRLKSLENSGWIERLANPEDARSMLVKLTPAGLQLIEQAAEAHVANQQRILANLSPQQREQIDASLRLLLAQLEP
ncbi:MarR family winged helix-turn-helix transcriptional regulator [Balneatrix alpica]|uniref:MarR family winged helix-turn-helix transcriptional regulator n=1 Tax=Balneatrix alpica TaxID=75684 RepID=A0ABV5ZDC1_9GAMM|nr:MarR family transcriptional regulator [Balneatrix alpica]